ncbi:MAG TPA: hypothetical protein PL064_13745, partial [Thermogutta sp.]|nr:hypothetical protein [Thermogutta sp.]
RLGSHESGCVATAVWGGDRATILIGFRRRLTPSEIDPKAVRKRRHASLADIPIPTWRQTSWNGRQPPLRRSVIERYGKRVAVVVGLVCSVSARTSF